LNKNEDSFYCTVNKIKETNFYNNKPKNPINSNTKNLTGKRSPFVKNDYAKHTPYFQNNNHRPKPTSIPYVQNDKFTNQPPHIVLNSNVHQNDFPTYYPMNNFSNHRGFKPIQAFPTVLRTFEFNPDVIEYNNIKYQNKFANLPFKLHKALEAKTSIFNINFSSKKDCIWEPERLTEHTIFENPCRY